ncbi:MAG: hypothetical protein ACR2NG_00260 [Acidimicrobiia bacterium]
MRKLALVFSLVLLVLAIAAPATATKPGTVPELEEFGDGHKIWICHATRSLSNPFVKIQIDIAAWDVADPDSNDHGPDHHAREKDGITWHDYALDNPEDECTLPPQRPVCVWNDGRQEVDYVVDFDKNIKLYPAIYGPNGEVTSTVGGLSIDKGWYDVILVSGDYDRGQNTDGTPLMQPHESWRLLGTENSGYSDDLDPDTVGPVTGVETDGLFVHFNATKTSLTAEHWSVGMADDSNANSVVAEAACLTKRDGPPPPEED